MAGSQYESVLCVKSEVFVYNIPARSSNRGYRAADWSLDKPDWVGRLKVVSKEKQLLIRLEDKNSGELFAQCPVDSYPGAAVEQVLDSSRYFVIRIRDDSGRSAFIGIGFADRGDSFDLLVAIQDHFKWLKRESEREKDEKNVATQISSGPKLDLGFKEGQTIKININTKRQGDDSETGPSKPRGRPQGSGGIGILPPPPGPGASKILPPPRAPSAVAATSQNTNNTASLDLLGGSRPLVQSQAQTRTGASGSNSLDLLMNLGPSVQGTTGTGLQPLQPQPMAAAPQNNDPWGDFASASGSASSGQSNTSSNEWVSFE